MKMAKVFFIIAFALVAQLISCAEIKYCNGVLKIGNIYYTEGDPIRIPGYPTDLVANRKSGNLYFTQTFPGTTTPSVWVYRRGQSQPTKLDKIGKIPQTTAVDQNTGTVYIGTNQGIYKLNENDFTAVKYAAENEDIINIAIGGNGQTIYANTAGNDDEDPRVIKNSNNGKTIETLTIIDYSSAFDLATDDKNNIIYTENSVPYILKQNARNPVVISGTDNTVNGFTIDKNGKLYAVTRNGRIYLIDVGNATATQVENLGIAGVSSIAFDNDDNIFVGLTGSIKKFEREKKNPCIN